MAARDMAKASRDAAKAALNMLNASIVTAQAQLDADNAAIAAHQALLPLANTPTLRAIWDSVLVQLQSRRNASQTTLSNLQGQLPAKEAALAAAETALTNAEAAVATAQAEHFRLIGLFVAAGVKLNELMALVAVINVNDPCNAAMIAKLNAVKAKSIEVTASFDAVR